MGNRYIPFSFVLFLLFWKVSNCKTNYGRKVKSLNTTLYVYQKLGKQRSANFTAKFQYKEYLKTQKNQFLLFEREFRITLKFYNFPISWYNQLLSLYYGLPWISSFFQLLLGLKNLTLYESVVRF